MDKKRLKVWKNGRILYYYTQADANFWDVHWDSLITKEYYKKYEAGNLEELSPFLEKYLHKEDFILEAGCGPARYVVALRARGFCNVEGIDWGIETISRVKAIHPDLPIKVGDVTKIETGHNFYDGYISLGVVEHCQDGPEPYLAEAYRVLKPGGYAFITVPYVNLLRNIKGRLGFYGQVNNPSVIFYQYAYSKTEFRSFLEKAGFETVENRGISGYFGLKEELPSLFLLFDCLPGGWKIKHYLKKSDRVNVFGHMILFICKKKS